MSNKDVTDIIEGIKAGGKIRSHNESKLFEDFKNFVQLGVHKYHVSIEDAQEAYSETIRCVIQNIDSGKYKENTGKSLEGYAAIIFRNKCIDCNRANIKRIEPINDTLLNNLPGPVADIVINIIDQKELRKKIDQCYMKIGDPCKKLLMYVKEGFRDKEIAGAMSYNSVDVAKQARYNCRKKLVACLNLSEDERFI